jgi:hypothetical protein
MLNTPLRQERSYYITKRSYWPMVTSGSRSWLRSRERTRPTDSNVTVEGDHCSAHRSLNCTYYRLATSVGVVVAFSEANDILSTTTPPQSFILTSTETPTHQHQHHVSKATPTELSSTVARPTTTYSYAKSSPPSQLNLIPESNDGMKLRGLRLSTNVSLRKSSLSAPTSSGQHCILRNSRL